MTGGDELSTDVKFKDRENFTNTAKILFSTNHYFSFADDDGGAKLRRTTVIPFTRTIPQSEQNFDLVAYLEEEKDAVVVKALYNYCNLRDRNYIFPGDYAVNDAIGGEDLSDCVAQFLIENCVEADVWTSTSEFFEEFCRQFGAMCAMNTFSEILHLIVKDTYPSVKKKRGRINGQGNPVGGYLGLALKTEDSSTASTT